MSAYRAHTWRLLSNHNVAAVSALPDDIAIFAEHAFLCYVVEQFAVALFMRLFNSSNTFKQFCNCFESFFMCYLCKTSIHVGPLIVFTVCSSLEVFCSRFYTAVKQFEPKFCMLFFICSCFIKDICNLFKTIFACLACKPVVLVPCHRFTCKCSLQVSFCF